jgi:hypothetical protein
MELTFTIQSNDTTWSLEQTQVLKNRIQAEGIKNLKVEQVRKKLNEDEAGGFFEPVIKFFFGKDFLTSVTDVVKEWVKSRSEVISAQKPIIICDITKDNGQKISIRLENIKDADTLLEKIGSLQ